MHLLLLRYLLHLHLQRLHNLLNPLIRPLEQRHHKICQHHLFKTTFLHSHRRNNHNNYNLRVMKERVRKNSLLQVQFLQLHWLAPHLPHRLLKRHQACSSLLRSPYHLTLASHQREVLLRRRGSSSNTKGRKPSLRTSELSRCVNFSLETQTPL